MWRYIDVEIQTRGMGLVFTWCLSRCKNSKVAYQSSDRGVSVTSNADPHWIHAGGGFVASRCPFGYRPVNSSGGINLR